MSNIKTMVRGAYDIQQLRVQMGNRIVGNFKAKLGQEPSKPEKELGKEEIAILNMLRRQYKKITDGVKVFPRQKQFKGDEVISTYTELCLLRSYIRVEEDEDMLFSMLKQVLLDYPIYTEWLVDVKGVGERMAGVLISEIDISRARYPSSLWKYAGLDVADDRQGRSRRAEHLIDVEYLDKDKKPATRKSITFNPFLKTKLVGVLAKSFLRCNNERYREIYDNYKNRLENHPDHVEKTKGHRHNMAMRYMIKQFLVDLYKVWRVLEGLPIAPSYQEAKLEHVHSAGKK